MAKGKLFEKISKLSELDNDATVEVFRVLQEAMKEFPHFPESDRAKDFARYSLNADDWFEKWFGENSVES
jgi:hypothetical protein